MKQSEIKNLSLVELKKSLVDVRIAFTKIKNAHIISPIENPLQIRILRRLIARLNTEIKKRDSLIY